MIGDSIGDGVEDSVKFTGRLNSTSCNSFRHNHSPSTDTRKLHKYMVSWAPAKVISWSSILMSCGNTHNTLQIAKYLVLLNHYSLNRQSNAHFIVYFISTITILIDPITNKLFTQYYPVS